MSDILGMTGTRNLLTEKQVEYLREQITLCDELHHGACVGADETAHDQAVALEISIVVHPPVDERLMMPKWKWTARWCIHVMTAKPYLDRNRHIVDGTDYLVALPDGPERPTGGTWYTVRYAEEVGKPVAICYPDGEVELRLPE